MCDWYGTVNGMQSLAPSSFTAQDMRDMATRDVNCSTRGGDFGCNFDGTELRSSPKLLPITSPISNKQQAVSVDATVHHVYSRETQYQLFGSG